MSPAEGEGYPAPRDERTFNVICLLYGLLIERIFNVICLIYGLLVVRMIINLLDPISEHFMPQHTKVGGKKLTSATK